MIGGHLLLLLFFLYMV